MTPDELRENIDAANKKLGEDIAPAFTNWAMRHREIFKEAEASGMNGETFTIIWTSKWVTIRDDILRRVEDAIKLVVDDAEGHA